MQKISFTISILFIVLSIGLSSCFHNQTRILKVESQDSTRSNLPFLLAYFDEDDKTSQDSFMVVRHTPFNMTITGTKYFIIIKDTSSINPALHASLGEYRQMFFHNSTVVITEGKAGIIMRNLL